MSEAKKRIKEENFVNFHIHLKDENILNRYLNLKVLKGGFRK